MKGKKPLKTKATMMKRMVATLNKSSKLLLISKRNPTRTKKMRKMMKNPKIRTHEKIMRKTKTTKMMRRSMTKKRNRPKRTMTESARDSDSFKYRL